MQSVLTGDIKIPSLAEREVPDGRKVAHGRAGVAKHMFHCTWEVLEKYLKILSILAKYLSTSTSTIKIQKST